MSDSAIPFMLALLLGHIIGFALLLRELVRGFRIDRAMDRIVAHRMRSAWKETPCAE